MHFPDLFSSELRLLKGKFILNFQISGANTGIRFHMWLLLHSFHVLPEMPVCYLMEGIPRDHQQTCSGQDSASGWKLLVMCLLMTQGEHGFPDL